MYNIINAGDWAFFQESLQKRAIESRYSVGNYMQDPYLTTEVVTRLADGEHINDIASSLCIDRETIAAIMQSERGRLQLAKEIHKGEVVNRAVVSVFNTQQALEMVFGELKEGLDSVGWEKPRTRVEILAEMRQSIALGVDIMKTLYNTENVRNFQKIVIETIGKLSPEAQKQLIAELQQQKTLIGVTSVPQSTGI